MKLGAGHAATGALVLFALFIGYEAIGAQKKGAPKTSRPTTMPRVPPPSRQPAVVVLSSLNYMNAWPVFNLASESADGYVSSVPWDASDLDQVEKWGTWSRRVLEQGWRLFVAEEFSGEDPYVRAIRFSAAPGFKEVAEDPAS